MLIECLVRRNAPVVTHISSDTYEFEFDQYGRRVCEVFKEDHIKAFLAVANMYREAPEVPDAAPAAADEADSGQKVDANRDDAGANGQSSPTGAVGLAPRPGSKPAEPTVEIPTDRKGLMAFLKRNGIRGDPTLKTEAMRQIAIEHVQGAGG